MTRVNGRREPERACNGCGCTARNPCIVEDRTVRNRRFVRGCQWTGERLCDGCDRRVKMVEKLAGPIIDTTTKVYEAIKKYASEHQRAPTFREIGRIARLRSTNAVKDHVERLKHHGLVEYDPRKTRTLRITMDLPPEMIA